MLVKFITARRVTSKDCVYDEIVIVKSMDNSVFSILGAGVEQLVCLAC